MTAPPPMPFISVLPGEFPMGSPTGDPLRSADESGAVITTIPRPFELGATAVTFDQWDSYGDAVGSEYRPSDMGWDRGNNPVINVSWRDAQEYLDWLTQVSGILHRLPTETEWEYAARAGTTTRYWWGDASDREYANFSTKRSGNKSKPNARRTEPVRTYPPNHWGFHEMNGNVWEWCADTWSSPESPAAAPRPDRRVLRGGAWDSDDHMIRNAYRTHLADWVRMNNVGFRVLREI